MTKGPPKTVMVVEDDPSASAGLLAALSRHGFVVISVGNGRIAWEHLSTRPAPDVILLDLVMPEMDGWQFLDRLKGTVHANIPVIVTTGTELTADWVTARGGSGWLHKLYTPEDLLAELRRILGSS